MLKGFLDVWPHHICKWTSTIFFLRSSKYWSHSSLSAPCLRIKPQLKTGQNFSPGHLWTTIQWVPASISHLPQTTDHFLYVLFFNRSMRATIFNVCAILSLFSVAIHAAPPSVPYVPRTLPECPITPIIGIGPVCSPRPTPTPYKWWPNGLIYAPLSSLDYQFVV